MKLLNKMFGEFLTGSRGAALLALRIVAGVAFMFHGWYKIQHPFDWIK